MFNSPLCCSCDAPASYVCLHDQCKLNPYICESSCGKGSAIMIHSHNNIPNINQKFYLPLQKVASKIQTIKNKLDGCFDTSYKEEIEKAGSRVQSLIAERIHQHLQKLQKTKIKLIPIHMQVLEAINNRNKDNNLLGQQIYKLINEQGIYQNPEMIQRISFVKNEFKMKLDWVQNMFLPNFLNTLLSNSTLEKHQNIFEPNNNFSQKIIQKYQQLCQMSHNLMGKYFTTVQKYEEAEVQFKKCSQLSCSNYLVLVDLASVNERMDKYPQAINYYTRALILNPRSSELFRARRDCYQKNYDFQNAIKDHLSMQECDPKSKDGITLRKLIKQNQIFNQSSIHNENHENSLNYNMSAVQFLKDFKECEQKIIQSLPLSNILKKQEIEICLETQISNQIQTIVQQKKLQYYGLQLSFSKSKTNEINIYNIRTL